MLELDRVYNVDFIIFASKVGPLILFVIFAKTCKDLNLGMFYVHTIFCCSLFVFIDFISVASILMHKFFLTCQAYYSLTSVKCL